MKIAKDLSPLKRGWYICDKQGLNYLFNDGQIRFSVSTEDSKGAIAFWRTRAEARTFLAEWKQGSVKSVSPAARRFTKFNTKDLVRKISGSHWEGRIVGIYSTKLTPEGYAVESSSHPGSVQIYPAKVLELVPQVQKKPPVTFSEGDKVRVNSTIRELSFWFVKGNLGTILEKSSDDEYLVKFDADVNGIPNDWYVPENMLELVK